MTIPLTACQRDAAAWALGAVESFSEQDFEELGYTAEDAPVLVGRALTFKPGRAGAEAAGDMAYRIETQLADIMAAECSGDVDNRAGRVKRDVAASFDRTRHRMPDTLLVNGEVRFTAAYFRRQLAASDIANAPFSKDLPGLYYVAENTTAPGSAMELLLAAVDAAYPAKLPAGEKSS